MVRGILPALAAALWVAAFALPGQSQQRPESPILTLDQERFFSQSLWGKRVTAEIEAASADLAAENRRIEADLTAEEKTLTERRPAMSAEEFRKAADDFDARVVGIRAAQDAKANDIAARRDRERQLFFQAVLPELARILNERGAVAILDNRAIFVAADAIDATDTLIQAVDSRLGAGPMPEAETPPAQPEAPGPVAPQSVAPQPVAPQPVAPQPVAPQPVAPQPGAPGTAPGGSP